MKFLVTGASGQLGSEWVKQLDKNGILFSAFNSNELDITNPSDIRRKMEEHKPDVVINCGAYTNVDGAESEFQKALSVNRDGVMNLAQYCNENQIMLVHYSTDYVFPGSKKDAEFYPHGYPEDAKTGPINRYGESKLAGEKELKKIGSDYLLIRVSWLCGAEGSNFVKTMLSLAESRNEVMVVDDQIGSPSFTFDVVEKTLALLKLEKNGCYHVSSSGKITWADFADQIFNEANKKVFVKRIRSEEFDTKAARPLFSLLSNEKCKRLGVDQLDWEKGLQRLLSEIHIV